MLSKKELLNLKQNIYFFNECLKNYENYDILSLTRRDRNMDFSSKDILSFWEGIGLNIKNGIDPDNLEMYIHIPFCEEFCDFCVYYKKLLIKNKKTEIDIYIDFLIQQMEYFAPAFKGAVFKALSVGGGTPSILSSEQITRLFGKLFELFEFDKYAYKGIEFRPSSTNEDKLIAIKNVGFETIHFGVQSLDSTVLENMNRGIDTEQKVKESISLVRKYGFDNLTVHLIRGLKGDTIEKFSYTLNKLFEYGVDKINIYGLITKKFYLDKHYDTTVNNFYQGFYNKFSNDLIEILPKISEDNNYLILDELIIHSHSWRLKRKGFKKKKQRYGYCDITSGDINLLGFGPSSRSFRMGKIIYESKRHSYKNFDINEKIYMGSILSIKDEMLRFILTGFRDFDKISIVEFNNKFGIDIKIVFKEELKYLLYLKKIKFEGNSLIFLEKNKKMRMLYSMILVGKDNF